MSDYLFHLRQILALSLLVTLATLALSLARVWPTLRTWAQINTAQTDLPSPGAYLNVLGYAASGRPLEAYTFGQGHDCLLLIGGIHGNERGGVSLLDRLIEYLADQPQPVLTDKRVVILPLANPDGYYDREDKLNSHEVNLNRNFQTIGWSEYEDEADPMTYAGPEPFSEVESRVIRDLAQSCSRSVMVSLHSQGALVSPEVDDASIALAKWYADKTGYKYYDEWDYAGTATRWLVESSGNPAITVELTNHTDSDWRINKAALLELVSN